MLVGSVNVAGFSLFKLFLLLTRYPFDVLCLQEMWLPPSKVKPCIPGYNLYEYRREKGSRGGIAIFVRKELKVVTESGNEYA